jgi:hypothetical protein
MLRQAIPTNNGKVADDISNRYQYRERLDPLTRKGVNVIVSELEAIKKGLEAEDK